MDNGEFLSACQTKTAGTISGSTAGKKVSKDWIMENYLNTINLGQNTLGVQAASRRYFGKDVSELNLSECAVIAGITQNPSKYNPISHPEDNAVRREKVLTNMRDQGYIDDVQYEAAMQDNVYDRIQETNTKWQSSDSNATSYFVDATDRKKLLMICRRETWIISEASRL